METKFKQLLKTIKLNESMLSMLFGVVTVFLIGVLIMRMYKTNTPSITPEAENTQIAENANESKSLADVVIVEKGQHLWAIAEKYYGSGYNWVDIAKENNLSNPSQVEVGQELKMPKVAAKEEKTESVVANINNVDVDSNTKIEGDSYTVVKGDHLWAIAVRAYGDGYKWVEIAKNNEISHPNYIEVGQVLKLSR